MVAMGDGYHGKGLVFFPLKMPIYHYRLVNFGQLYPLKCCFLGFIINDIHEYHIYKVNTYID